MRKLVLFGAAALLTGALAGSVQPRLCRRQARWPRVVSPIKPRPIRAWSRLGGITDTMGGGAATTTAGAIITRTGMRTTGVPGISKVNSTWIIDDCALLGSRPVLRPPCGNLYSLGEPTLIL